MPLEPPPSPWRFPEVTAADEHGLVGVGADLEPGTLLHAYRHGLFPMPIGRRQLGWWSPDPRGVLPLDGLVVSGSDKDGNPAETSERVKCLAYQALARCMSHPLEFGGDRARRASSRGLRAVARSRAPADCRNRAARADCPLARPLPAAR